MRGQQVDRNRINELEGFLSQSRTEIARLNSVLESKHLDDAKKNHLTFKDPLHKTNNITVNHYNVLLEKAR